MNELIIDQFSKLLKQIQAEYLNSQVENDPKEIKMHGFRLSSVKKILGILKNINFDITSGDELTGIEGIGKHTINRVNEIIEKGVLSELSDKYDASKQTKIDSIQELENVIGIGPATARKLVIKYKITSVNELNKAIKKGTLKVNNLIKLGLKYYGIVKGNIPRKEIQLVEKYLHRQVKIVDDDLQMIICGSYRRGKPTSGDIDLLLYHPNIKTMTQLESTRKTSKKNDDSCLNILVNNLTDNGFLLDAMTDKCPNQKYMGFCKYKNNPVRRLDIRFVPYNSLPTALVYFTGPAELNKYMRQAAINRKLTLNEYGLYKEDLTKPNKVGERVKITSEKDVFEKLGMKYLTPVERESYS